MNKQFVISLLAFTCLSTISVAQQDQQQSKTSEGYYKQHPVWIDMMNDPNVNYFEACRAFDLYWQDREIPAETEGEAAKLYSNEKEEDKGIVFKKKETYQYIYEYKKFINWRKAMENKVNPDNGKLLTQEEQHQLWKQQTEGVDTNIE